MPIYKPDHVEYSITSGLIHIAMEDGRNLPAFWAHPKLGSKFSAVAVVHDWWGLTPMIRRVANLFAQTGHYVIVPDLFNGQVAETAQEAMKLFDRSKENNYARLDNALEVLENHHQCNKSVAAVGIGMGGSLAFEAAITRDDLEAAVAYSGFPQRYLDAFHKANTPICAFFGEAEPYIEKQVIEAMTQGLNASPAANKHEVHIVPEIEHSFFSETLSNSQRQRSRDALKQTLDFLDKYLEKPISPRHSSLNV